MNLSNSGSFEEMSGNGLSNTLYKFVIIIIVSRYIWTSGRKCNFAGCDRPDLQPPNINGWFWSGSGAKIGPTTQRGSGDWSLTGGYGQPQPDNREAAQVIYDYVAKNYSVKYALKSNKCHCTV